MPNPAVSILLAHIDADAGFAHQTFRDFELLLCPADESRNRGAERAQGEFLAFVTADPLWAPEKLEKQMAALARQPDADWCYCGDAAGDILRALLLKNFIPAGSVLVRRSVFQAMNGFNEAFSCRDAQDWDLWLRLAATHAVCVVPALLVDCHGEQRPAPFPEHMKQVVEAAVARHPKELIDLRSDALAEVFIAAGNLHLLHNEREEARFRFEEALTHAPLRTDAYLSWISSFLSSEAQRQIRDLHQLSRVVKQGARSQEPEARSRELGAGSREPGVRN